MACNQVKNVLDKDIPSPEKIHETIIPNSSKSGIFALFWKIGTVDKTNEDIKSKEYLWKITMRLVSNRWYNQFGLLMGPIVQHFGKPLPEGQLSFLFESERNNPREFFIGFQNQRYGGIFSHNMVLLAEGLKSPFSLEHWEGELLDHLEKHTNSVALTLKRDGLYCLINGNVPMNFIVFNDINDDDAKTLIGSGDMVPVNDGDFLMMQGSYGPHWDLNLIRLKELLFASPLKVAGSLIQDSFTSLRIRTVRRPQSTPIVTTRSFSKPPEDESFNSEMELPIDKADIKNVNQEIALNDGKLELISLPINKEENNMCQIEEGSMGESTSKKYDGDDEGDNCGDKTNDNDKINGEKQDGKIAEKKAENLKEFTSLDDVVDHELAIRLKRCIRLKRESKR